MQITSWVWRCLSSGQMPCCSISGTRMKCWQSSPTPQHLSLARVLLCAGSLSHLQLKSPLWRIPRLTPGEGAVSAFWDGLLSHRASGSSKKLWTLCMLSTYAC